MSALTKLREYLRDVNGDDFPVTELLDELEAELAGLRSIHAAVRQRVRDEVLEEAARVCDKWGRDLGDVFTEQAGAAECCARHIRELKGGRS